MTLQEKAIDAHASITAPDVPTGIVEVLTLPADTELEAARAALLNAPRDQEWHVTVTGLGPVAWASFCRSLGVEPLFIELNDHRLQLLCTLRFDPRLPVLADVGPTFLQLCEENEGCRVVRVKHQVRTLAEGEVALYHEAHAKLDGPWRPDRRGASRDLYRLAPGRWYLTRRGGLPIDGPALAELTESYCKPSVLVGVEVEAVLEDTNPGLDAGWL